MSIISYNDIYTVYAWQENNRTFTVTTNEGGIKHIRLILKDKQTALNVSGEEVSIYYAATKPNNKEVLVSASKIDAENGVIEFPIEPALTTNSGVVNGEIRVVAPLGVLKFYGINLKVHKGVSDKAAEQTEAYTALVEALRKVSALLASSTIAPLDDINEFDTGDKGRLNPVASGVLYEILQRYVKNDLTIAGLKLTKPITTTELQDVLSVNGFYAEAGKPTVNTKGKSGDLRYDITTKKLYLCTNASKTTYTWKDISEFIDISDVLQNYVLNTVKVAGLSLNKDIEIDELSEALNHYPLVIFTDTPTTSTKGKVGQFGGLINYNASSQSYTVKLFLCCSAGKSEGTYQWVLINSNTISDEQIKSALDNYLDNNPITGVGKDGEDGITPHIGDNGNWYIGDIDTGKPSKGKDGANGADGYSPSISVSSTETGYMLAIEHDENFTENVFIENGKDGTNGVDGKDGVNGVDGTDGADGKSAYEYAKESGYTGTEEEFAQSLNYVNTVDTLVDEAVENEKGNIIDSLIAELQGLPVFGTVDENNIIKVTSQLSDGVYVLRYENTDGTYSEVGTITIGNGDVVTYTNLNDPTLATDTTLTPASIGWMEDVRISSSSSSISSAEGYDVSNFVAISAGKEVVRIKNFNLYNAYGRIYFYSGGEYKYQLSNITTTGAAHFNTVNDNYAEITVAKLTEVYKSAMGSSATFDSIRFGGMLVGTIEDVIITLDEVIA